MILFDAKEETMTANQEQQQDTKRNELKRVIVRASIGFIVFFIILGGFLFIAAGTTAWTRGWIYLGITLLFTIVSRVILFVINPEAAIQRSKRVKPTLLFDKIYLALSIPLYLILMVVAGLDAVRFGWSYLSMSWTWVGSVGFIFFAGFAVWPLIVNPYFEATVRIQEDRAHEVIDTGPYRIVRHPSYTAGIFVYVFTPLILGSLYSFIPSGLIIILVVYRTVNEDRFLRKELKGYEEYAKRTRYQLIPGIW